MTMRNKFFALAAAALTAGSALAISTSDAEARWRGHRGYNGGAVAAGVIGGLALGALAAGAASPAYGYSYGSPYYAQPAPTYYPQQTYYYAQPAPTYYGGGGYGYEPGYYQPRCRWVRQRVRTDAWNTTVQRVRVCH